ncbi:MAG: ATP-binding protein, partial [Cyanobacteria bacterium J06649_4]
SRIDNDCQYQGIVVGDTGPGIPPADLEHLFERNYRGVQAEGDIPGTGLGLAIAQTLMREMQGYIEVISPAVGTPWMPVSALQNPESEANCVGPGSAFIVWLAEVERLATS